MATALVSDVLDEVSKDLFDAGRQRWVIADLLDYINRGVREIFNSDPTAFTVVDTVTANAGVSRTSIYSGDQPAVLLNVVGLRQLNEATLAAEDPAWELATASEVDGYIVKPEDYRQMFFYPSPLVDTGYIVTVGTLPEEYTDVTDPLVIKDEYVPTLHNFVMAAAYLREGAGQNLDKAAAYDTAYKKGLE